MSLNLGHKAEASDILGNAGARTEPSKAKKRRYTRTGLAALRARVKVRGMHALDTRTAGAQDLLRWRSELIADLGGEKAISTQQRSLIELATRTRLYVDHVDAWLMEQSSLIFIKRKTVHPILLQRQTFADALARYLEQLGLERRKPVIPIRDLLAEDSQATVNESGAQSTESLIGSEKTQPAPTWREKVLSQQQTKEAGEVTL
jgi:hypothetical protein